MSSFKPLDLGDLSADIDSTVDFDEGESSSFGYLGVTADDITRFTESVKDPDFFEKFEGEYGEFQMLDIGEGILSGLVDLVVAIPELSLLGLDTGVNGTQYLLSKARGDDPDLEEPLLNTALYFRGLIDDFKEGTGVMTPDTVYGEITNMLTAFGGGTVAGIKYANAASRSAHNAKRAQVADELRRKNPYLSPRQIDDVLPISVQDVGKAGKRKVVPLGPNILPMVISAEALGASKFGQQVFASPGARGAFYRGLGTSGSVAVADFSVAPDGAGTLSDAFDALPNFMETESRALYPTEDMGFFDRADNFRRIRNKLRIGAEGAVLSGAFDVLLHGIPAASKLLTAGDITPKAARFVGRTGSAVASGYKTLFRTADEQANAPHTRPKPNVPTKRQKLFTTTRGLTSSMYENMQDAGYEIMATERRVANNLALYAKETESFMEQVRGSVGMVPRETNQQQYTDLIDYLEGRIVDEAGEISPEKFAELGYNENAVKAAERMRQARNALSESIERSAREEIEVLDEQLKLGNLAPSEMKKMDKRRQLISETLSAFQELDGKYLSRRFAGGITRENIEAFQRTTEFNQLVVETAEAMNKVGSATFKNMSPTEQTETARQFVLDMIGKERDELARFGVASLDDRIIDAQSAINKTLARLQDDGGLAKGRPIYEISEDLLSARSKILEKTPRLRGFMGEITPRGTSDVVQPQGRGAEYLDAPKLTDKEAANMRVLGSVTQMKQLEESIRFYRSLLDDSSITKTFAEFQANPNMPAPMILKDVPEDQAQRLRQNNQSPYVEIIDDSQTVFGSRYGPLKGTFVRLDAFEALTLVGKDPGDAINQIAETFVQLKGLTQMGKTVLSPATQARNLTSFPFFLAANGNFLRGGQFSDTIDLAMGKLINMADDEFENFTDYIVRSGLFDEGVVLDETKSLLSASREKLRETGRAGAKKQEPLGLVQRFSDFSSDKIRQLPGGEQILKIGSKPYKGAVEAYRFSDNMVKIGSLLGERAKYTASLRNPLNSVLKNIDGPGVPVGSMDDATDFDEIIEEYGRQGIANRVKSTSDEGLGTYRNKFDYFTADIVKDTVPVYARTFEAAKKVSRFPVGNFVAFQSELIRNTANIVSKGSHELAFKATPELEQAMFNLAVKKISRKTLRPVDELLSDPQMLDTIQTTAKELAKKHVHEVNAIGLQRLLGYTATVAGFTGPMARAITSVSGADEKELEALYVFAPFYYKDQQLAMLSKPKDGVFQYTNLSTNQPYDALIAPAIGAIREFNQGGKLDKPFNANMTNSFLRFAINQMEPFGNEAILTTAVADIFVRGGRTREGRRIFGPSDDGLLVAEKSLRHIAGQLSPTIVREFIDIRGIEKGRLTRALTDSPNPNTRLVDEEVTEFLRLITGVGTHNFDAKIALRYAGAEFKKIETDIQAQLGGVIARGNTTEQDVIDAVAVANEKYHKAQQDFYQKLNAAEALGVDAELRDDVFEAFNQTYATDAYKDIRGKRGQGFLENVAAGNFVPIRVTEKRLEALEQQEDIVSLGRGITSSEQIKAAAEFANSIANEASFNRLDRRYSNPFERLEERQEPQNRGSFLDRLLSEAQAASPNALSLPSAPPVASLPTATGPQTPLNPELYGDNVVEQARNMELAKRLGRA